MSDEQPTPAEPTPPHPRILTSEELLQGERELIIVHDGKQYLLRITKNGRLLLNRAD